MPSLEDLAHSIENAGRILAHWIGASTHDQLVAVPSLGDFSRCRSGYAIAAEVVEANRGIAARLRQEEPAPRGMTTFDSVEAASRAVLESAGALADVVRGLTPEALTRVYQVPFGQIPGAALMALAANHMYYHGGQINYIQRLYGDEEFSLPPSG